MYEDLTEGIKIKPYKHQIDAVGFFHNKRDGLLLMEMGCVSGDTEITINRSGASKRYKISEAYARVPKMRDINGNIPEIYTRSFNGTTVQLHKIVEIKYSGKKETLNLELLDGKSIRLTADHEVMTAKGFIEAGKLTPLDHVMIDSPKPIKKAGRVKVNYLYTRVEDHPYGRKKEIIRRNKYSNRPETYYIVPTHRLIAERELNNGNFLDPKVYAVHHKDRDPRNNSVDNLQILTHDEHRAVHTDDNKFNFSQGNPELVGVKSITSYGIEDTYDIICEDPHRNFVANGIVVHNCGKTGTAILMAALRYKQSGRMLRTLIVSPPAVIHNWKHEFSLFSKVDASRIHPLAHSNGAKKAEHIYNNVIPQHEGAVVITNYEALINESIFKAISSWCPELIIFDEIHMLKSAKSKRSKASLELAKNSVYRLGLTGTPILNNVNDIFGIFKVIDNGDTFGTNEFVFQSKYLMDMNAGWKSRPGYFPKLVNNPKTFPELNEKIYRKSIRKLKSECLDLPDLVKIIRHAEWGKDQKKAYDDMTRDFLTWVDTQKKDGMPDSVTANLAVTKAMRLMQIASGFVTTDLGETHIFKDCPRLDLLTDLLTEVLDGGHKCILWCSYKANYKMLADVCTKLGAKHVFITGEQNTNEKHESNMAFQTDPEVRVVIANRAAGGTGINLTAAAYSIVYSRNFSLAEELQSEARNHRGGSEIHDKITKIDLAIKDSVDDKALQALVNKHQVSMDIVDMVRGK